MMLWPDMVVHVEDENQTCTLSGHVLLTHHGSSRCLLLRLLSLLACVGAKAMWCIPRGGHEANRCAWSSSTSICSNSSSCRTTCGRSLFANLPAGDFDWAIRTAGEPMIGLCGYRQVFAAVYTCRGRSVCAVLLTVPW